MAAPRSFSACLPALLALWNVSCGATTLPSNKKNNPERCGFKVQSGAEGSRKLAVTLRSDNCSSNSPPGKHVIHEVADVSFTHLACDRRAGVLVHWAASPLGIEHIKGFRVYLEDKSPEGKRCQHLVLKEPRQLNFSYKNTKLSSQPFGGLSFDTDYMVRVVPFPTLMNDSFFPPSFVRTNSCEVLLGWENPACKPFWKPKTLSVRQSGAELRVSFERAPPSFAFRIYYVYYKLRQDGPFGLRRCEPDATQPRTTCVLRGLAPGTYTIELRDESNTTRRQTQYYVSQAHSPWAGPIRAVAITVPLVVMSALATLFTVACRKKQRENIYSQLDEESGESSNQGAAGGAERPRPRPKVFLCYSDRDGPKHAAVIQSFAYFLQDFCGCQVVLDLWEHLEMCQEGQMSWLGRRLDDAHFVIVVCSKGLRYFVERKSRRGKMPAIRDGGGDLFVTGVAMIGEKLRRAERDDAAATADGERPNALRRFMAVYFDYSDEKDVPAVLSLAPRLKLMEQLPELLARLHRGPPIQRRNYFRSKSGRSLYVAICDMHRHLGRESGAPAEPAGPPSPLPLPGPASPGLLLNRVVAESAGEGVLRKNALLDRVVAAPLPASPSTSRMEEAPCESEEDTAAATGGGVAGQRGPPPPPPRDSGIYESSVPSSELSIPLMDRADSSSLAESESSSSGLGDEEPPAVALLGCGAPTLQKVQLHHPESESAASH
ncbi:interleukin-17 receptor D [Stigmatopora nigra]